MSTTQLATPQLDYKQLDYKQLDYKQLDYNTEEEPEMEPVVARTERPEWKKPDFEEVTCAPEITMYVARWDD